MAQLERGAPDALVALAVQPEDPVQRRRLEAHVGVGAVFLVEGDGLGAQAFVERARIPQAEFGLARVDPVVLELQPAADDAVVKLDVAGIEHQRAGQARVAAHQRRLVGAGRPDALAAGVGVDVGAQAHAVVGVVADAVSVAEVLVRALAVDLGQLGRASARPAPLGLGPQAVQDAAVVDQVGRRADRCAEAGGLLAHHIGQDRAALHVDARRAAADQLDALHRRRGYALQDLVEGVVLGDRRLAVDVDIAAGSREAAHGLALVEGEARHADHHVVGADRLGLGEEAGRIGDHPALGRCWRDGRRRCGLSDRGDDQCVAHAGTRPSRFCEPSPASRGGASAFGTIVRFLRRR